MGKKKRQESQLKTDQGNTVVETTVVTQIAGIASQEVDGVQMGGRGSNAAGGLLESITGSSGSAPGVAVEVGEEEAFVDLSMSTEYGKSIPQLSEAVRRNVINRVENLTGLSVTEVNITVNDVQFPEQ